MMYLTKGSDLWMSREDLQQKREDFHGIQSSLTLDLSFYEEGGYFLLGLDAKKDRRAKYLNMCTARDAVLQEQTRQNAKSRWHSVVRGDAVNCISKEYTRNTTEAAKAAHQAAVRLEAELEDDVVLEGSIHTREMMSLKEVKELLQRSTRSLITSSTSALSFPSTTNSDFEEELNSLLDSEWSVDHSTDDELFEDYQDPAEDFQDPMVNFSISAADSWSVDFSTDDEVFEPKKVVEIFIPTSIGGLPRQNTRDNAIAA